MVDLEQAVIDLLDGESDDLDDLALHALAGGPPVPAAARAPRPVRAARVHPYARGQPENIHFIHKARVARAVGHLSSVRQIVPFRNKAGSDNKITDAKALDWLKGAFGDMSTNLANSQVIAAKTLMSRPSADRASTVVADALVSCQNKRIAQAWTLFSVFVSVFVFGRQRTCPTK